MSFDALGFLQDHGIPHEYQREGWVNVRCPSPHCGDTGMHGGFNSMEGYYHCWRCGSKQLFDILGWLTKENPRVLLRKYRGVADIGQRKTREYSKTIDLPGSELKAAHKRYLTERGFDPLRLAETYGLLGTGPGAKAWDMDWQLRVIIPLHDRAGRIIGCQGRDITGKHKLRYVGTPLENSLANYKETLYGAHLAQTRKVCVVEGVFDSWRLGTGFVASYGTAMTSPQIKQLAQWDQVFFLYDPEPTAQMKAKEYATTLTALGKECEVICLNDDSKDAGELTPAEALYIRRQLGFK